LGEVMRPVAFLIVSVVALGACAGGAAPGAQTGDTRASEPSLPGPSPQGEGQESAKTREEMGERAPSGGSPAPLVAAAPSAGGLGSGARGRAVTEVLKVKDAAFGEHPQVLVHAAGDLREKGPLSIVVFLHGWYGCVRVVAGAENAPCRPGKPTRVAMDVIG